jgi:hypothetical protein
MNRELDVGQSALLTDIAMCVNYYRLSTPGMYCCVHAPLQLDENTRLTPGILAMVNHGRHKQCDPGPTYDCFKGPPNFVLDVFPGNDLLDYESRRETFENANVIEYVAVRDTDPVGWIWNRLIDGNFSVIEADDNELIKSISCPGLWIPPSALKRRDWWSVMGSIAQGVTRVEHHMFMDTIWS